MARSLQEQLLKSGLATESSLKKARENKNASDKTKNKSSKPKKAYKHNTSRNPLNAPHQPKKQRDHNSNTQQPSQQSTTTTHTDTHSTIQATKKVPKGQKPKQKTKANNNEPSLASLYRQRAEVERKEKEDEEAKRREQARIKKQTRKKLRTLVLKHLKNDDQANLRYNFVVGSNVKYVFVTEEQQNQLAAGELAITFIDGKRCLVPADLYDQIKAIDPNKVVVIADANTTIHHEDIPADLEQPSLAENEALPTSKKNQTTKTINKHKENEKEKEPEQKNDSP